MTTNAWIDHHQVAYAALMLTRFCEEYKNDTPHALVSVIAQQCADALKMSVQHDTNAILSFGDYVIHAVSLNGSEAGMIPEGHTHAIIVSVDPCAVISACEAVAPSIDDIKAIARYIHLRVIDQLVIGDTVIAEEAVSKGGRTIAFVDNGDGTLTYAVARCHKHDTYVKKIGNHVAASRLMDPKHSRTIKATINEFRQLVNDGKIAGLE